MTSKAATTTHLQKSKRELRRKNRDQRKAKVANKLLAEKKEETKTVQPAAPKPEADSVPQPQVHVDLLTPILSSEEKWERACQKMELIGSDRLGDYMRVRVAAAWRNDCYFLQGIFPTAGGNSDLKCPYLYTVGLQWTTGHPDLAIVGMAQQGHIILGDVIQLIRDGKLWLDKDKQTQKETNSKTETKGAIKSKPGKAGLGLDANDLIPAKLVCNVPLQVCPISKSACLDHFGIGIKLSMALELPIPRYVQLVWPEKDGHFTSRRDMNARQFIF